MEVWKMAKGFEGAYEVSSIGNVKSNPRKIVDKNGTARTLDGFTLSKSVSDQGYLTVSINGDKHFVHRLVADAFIDNPLSKPCVNHIDGNKQNNTVDNLEWATYSENSKHAYANGLRRKPYGNKYRSKFTDDEVRRIRADKRTKADIAKDYGVSDVCICNIKNNVTYKEVR